jgi:hypothetical protein
MDDKTRARLRALRRLAEHPSRKIDRETLEQHAKAFDPQDPSTRGTSPYPTDQTVVLPLGWQVTVSIEDQPMGWAIHMSMSSPRKGKAPSPEVVQWVLEALGYQRRLGDCLLYLEHYAQDRVAVNVLEPLDVQKGN